MPLTKDKKIKITEELEDKFKRKKIAIFTDFHGISVSKLRILRQDLKKDGAEYKVSKKTLLDRALNKCDINIKTKEMQGEIGVAFGYDNEIAPVKTLFKFSRENDTFKLLGGVLDQKILTQEEVLQLARLPSREILISQLVGILQSPLRGLAAVLQGNLKSLMIVLSKIKK